MKALKKLIPAAAMLVLCAAMMTTATFAWFNMNNAVTVDPINTNVSAPKNLQISSSADTGWTDKLTGVTGSATTGINPVTTTDLTTWKATNKATSAGVASGNLSTLTLDNKGLCTTVTPGGSAEGDDLGDWEANKYFFTTFTVYLKNIGGEATDVYIDVENTSVTANATSSAQSGELMKSVTFVAQATVDSTTVNQQYVQDTTDDSMAKVAGYTVISGATNSSVLANLPAQSVATVKFTVWMEGTSEYCNINNVLNTTLTFDLALGFTTEPVTA